MLNKVQKGVAIRPRRSVTLNRNKLLESRVGVVQVNDIFVARKSHAAKQSNRETNDIRRGIKRSVCVARLKANRGVSDGLLEKSKPVPRSKMLLRCTQATKDASNRLWPGVEACHPKRNYRGAWQGVEHSYTTL